MGTIRVRPHVRHTRYGKIIDIDRHSRSLGKSMLEYERATGKSCPDCGGRLGRLENYPNNQGWKVRGYKEKQRLFKRCSKCRYEWDITYLGG